MYRIELGFYNFKFKKEAGLQEKTIKKDKTRYNRARQSPQIVAGQDNPTGGKDFHKQDKESEVYPLLDSYQGIYKGWRDDSVSQWSAMQEDTELGLLALT